MKTAIPEWLIIALEELQKGVVETPGPGNSPRIIEYHKTCSLKATEDSVPWCSAFVNFCITQAGQFGTDSAAAISWTNWGKEIEGGQLGCVVVMTRTGGNHTGFYLDEDDAGIFLLGGNQSDKVCVKHFPWDNITNFRMPNV